MIRFDGLVFVLIEDLGAMLGERTADTVRVLARRADFAVFLLTARAVFAPFFDVRLAVFGDRRAALVVWLLMSPI